MNYIRKDSTVLIIGGAGFIGHNLALKLKSEGVNVHIIDSFQVNNLLSLISNTDNVSNPELSTFIVEKRLKILKDKKIPIHVVDARDYHLLSENIAKINPDYVVHLAALTDAASSFNNPDEVENANLNSTKVVAQLCMEHAIKLILVSCCSVLPWTVT